MINMNTTKIFDITTHDERKVLNAINAELSLQKNDNQLLIDNIVSLSHDVFQQVQYITPSRRPLVNKVAKLMVKNGYALPKDLGRGKSKYERTEKFKATCESTYVTKEVATILANSDKKTSNAILNKVKRDYKEYIENVKWNVRGDYEEVKKELLERADIQAFMED